MITTTCRIFAIPFAAVAVAVVPVAAVPVGLPDVVADERDGLLAEHAVAAPSRTAAPTQANRRSRRPIARTVPAGDPRGTATPRAGEPDRPSPPVTPARVLAG